STRAFHVATIDGGSKRSARHHHGALRGIAIPGSATINTIVDFDIVLDRDGVARGIAGGRVAAMNEALNDFGVTTERNFVVRSIVAGTEGFAAIGFAINGSVITDCDFVAGGIAAKGPPTIDLAINGGLTGNRNVNTMYRSAATTNHMTANIGWVQKRN